MAQAKTARLKEGYEVPGKERWAFYLSAAFRDMSYAFLGGYLTYFYIDIMGLQGFWYGALLVACRIWDGIDDPLLGIFYDKRKYKQDKAKPFFKYIGLPGALLIVAIFYAPTFSPDAATNMMWRVLYAFVTYALFEAMQTINGTAYMSFYNSISTNADERSKIVSFSRLFSMGGSALISGVIPIILDFFPNSDVAAKTKIYLFSAIFVAACFLIYNLVMTKQVKERNILREENDQKKPTVKEMFRVFFKNKLLLLMMLSNSIGGILNAGSTSLYFYTYNLGSAALSTYIGFLAVPGAVLGSFIVPALTRRFDKSKIMVSCYAATVIISIAYLAMGYDHFFDLSIGSFSFRLPWVVAAYTFLSSFPGGIRGILYWNMIADTVDYEEWKTGKRNDGMVYSLEGCLSKIVGGIGSASTAVIIWAIKFVPNAETQTESTMKGLFYVPLIISIVSTLCSGIPYLFYKFSRQEQIKVIEMLKKRRAALARREMKA